MKRHLLQLVVLLLSMSTLFISVQYEATAANYKIVNKKLVNSKTGKLVKGTVIYKKKQYVNGRYKVDRVKPVLKMSSQVKSSYSIANGARFQLPKMTAVDRVSGTVKVQTTIKNSANKRISKITTTVAGTYRIYYVAKDAAGNSASKTIRVTVQEKELKSIAFYEKNQTVKVNGQGKVTLKVNYRDRSVKALKLPTTNVLFHSSNRYIEVTDQGEVFVSPQAYEGMQATVIALYTKGGKEWQARTTVTVAAATTPSKPVEYLPYAKSYEVANTSSSAIRPSWKGIADIAIYNADNVLIKSLKNAIESPYLQKNQRAIISFTRKNASKPVMKNGKATIRSTNEQAFTVVKIGPNGSVQLNNTAKVAGEVIVEDTLSQAKISFVNYEDEKIVSASNTIKIEKSKTLKLNAGNEAVLSNEGQREFLLYAANQQVNMKETMEQAYVKYPVAVGETVSFKITSSPVARVTSTTAGGSYVLSDFSETYSINEQAVTRHLSKDDSVHESLGNTKKKVFDNTGDSVLIISAPARAMSFEKLAFNGEKSPHSTEMYKLLPGKAVKIATTAPYETYKSNAFTVTSNRPKYILTTIKKENNYHMTSYNETIFRNNSVSMTDDNEYMVENLGDRTMYLAARAVYTHFTAVEGQYSPLIVQPNEKIRIEGDRESQARLIVAGLNSNSSYNMVTYNEQGSANVVHLSMEPGTYQTVYNLAGMTADFENTGDEPITLYTTTQSTKTKLVEEDIIKPYTLAKGEKVTVTMNPHYEHLVSTEIKLMNHQNYFVTVFDKEGKNKEDTGNFMEEFYLKAGEKAIIENKGNSPMQVYAVSPFTIFQKE